MWGRRRRREQELADRDRWRVARRMVDEDVTALGEQLAELHVETLADDLGHEAADHYRRALEHYEQATHLLSVSATAEDVLAVEQVVARRLTAGEEPLVRTVRVGDRWVPWHLAGGVEGVIDAGARLAGSPGHGVHGQQNLAQAYLNQVTGGADGAGGVHSG